MKPINITSSFSNLRENASKSLQPSEQSLYLVASLVSFMRSLTTELELNKSISSLNSSVFNPPKLSGLVTERTTLEAMISHSDNTGTDMALKHIGADKVREFIAEIGLHHTRIPNSTRQFLGYIFGADNWETITWDEVVALAESSASLAHPRTRASCCAALAWARSSGTPASRPHRSSCG